MTEEEWLASTDRTEMVSYVRLLRVSDRKERLFGCGCVRRIWPLVTDAHSRDAVEVAEWYADHPHADRKRLDEARWGAGAARTVIANSGNMTAWRAATAAHDATRDSCRIAANNCMAEAARAANRWDTNHEDATELQLQAILVRCIFGNPFRPVAFDARGRTADVLGLARGIYEERAFDRMPLLADALMDAGCADEQVIGHCRSAGPHARGCWVVDLVLGKE